MEIKTKICANADTGTIQTSAKENFGRYKEETNKKRYGIWKRQIGREKENNKDRLKLIEKFALFYIKLYL